MLLLREHIKQAQFSYFQGRHCEELERHDHETAAETCGGSHIHGKGSGCSNAQCPPTAGMRHKRECLCLSLPTGNHHRGVGDFFPPSSSYSSRVVINNPPWCSKDGHKCMTDTEHRLDSWSSEGNASQEGCFGSCLTGSDSPWWTGLLNHSCNT